MIQIINGIKIKTSTIDEAINLIFKKKKRYRELFLINSLTMNMIERLLLINELIIQKALEDLNVLKIEQKPIICVKYATLTQNISLLHHKSCTIESKMIRLVLFTAGG